MVASLTSDVLRVIAGALEIPANELSLDSSMETIERWDSLHHLNVIMDLEQEFQITLDADDVLQMNSVRKIVEMLETRLSDRPA